jgi:hypothetical protein
VGITARENFVSHVAEVYSLRVRCTLAKTESDCRVLRPSAASPIELVVLEVLASAPVFRPA